MTGVQTCALPISQVMAGVERWKLSQQWADGKIELASTFLDQNLFDEFPAAATNRNEKKSETMAEKFARLDAAKKARESK